MRIWELHPKLRLAQKLHVTFFKSYAGILYSNVINQPRRNIIVGQTNYWKAFGNRLIWDDFDWKTFDRSFNWKSIKNVQQMLLSQYHRLKMFFFSLEISQVIDFKLNKCRKICGVVLIFHVNSYIPTRRLSKEKEVYILWICPFVIFHILKA